MEKLVEELRDTREQLGSVEEEKSRAISELSEMKHAAHEAKEKSRKALNDLALALMEVASEASEAKEKLSAAQLELGQVKEEAGNLKEIIKSTKVGFGSNSLETYSKRQRVVVLALPNLQLQGTISPSLANLSFLRELNLGNSSFHGGIPYGLGHLPHLRVIDVQNNQLEGSVPTSLFQHRRVQYISLVFSKFSGEIWKGNRGLCGTHILEVPACAITNPGQQSRSKKPMLKIVIPVVTSSFMIFMLVSIWILKGQKKGKSKDVEKVQEYKTHQLVSYHEIQRATNYFDGSNLLGVGGFGSVYKGTLSSGIVVAIKVLDLQNEEVCKRFDTECEVMRNVRHKNLVSVITTCSSEYIRAFVLQYMPNGSLENWLYKEDRHLNLLQRVAIMLDVAIEYLHHSHHTHHSLRSKTSQRSFG
ncbi:hypothetical protein K7X08_001450 [Anisodus acutangulus]|uniref:Protein kinase domain-containing protein n=1 Tax=Anisodus acutangulus TaxID=402998 RepID=A0A9Q1MNY3_9SOLA|nr:hypothetical protein K7X08_001450 [Anisodus acutangulus]